MTSPLDPTFLEGVTFAPLLLKTTAGLGLVVFLGWLFVRMRVQDTTSGGGGLNYVVGPMGAGKSMYGVRQIVVALTQGKYVVTNVRLLDGWAEKVARHEFPRDRADRRERRIRWLEAHYVYEPSLSRAMRYRLPCARCGGDTRECRHTGPFQEGRGVFVWDETHNDLNNRDYQGHGATRELREAEKERRRLVIRWATQLRKLGFVGFLLSQHHENTDAQLRRVCNHLIRLQNQRTRGGFGAIMPRRFTLFLVYWYPAHLADGTRQVEAVRFERYVLPWTRVLYDSWETYHGIDDEVDEETTPILLPHRVDTPSRGAPALAGVRPC